MELLRRIDQLVWGEWLLCLLLGTGILLMVRMDFLPIRNLGFALKCIAGSRENRRDERGISPFGALATELAATIGIGNIVGVATAMVFGGPGALLWMMAAALLGLATKLVESSLAVKYRRRNENGEWVGGPMYTLQQAFPGRTGRRLGAVYAFLAVMASLGMGNMTQANAIAQACSVTFRVPVARTGLVLTLLTIAVILGGIRGIAKLTQILVPAMGLFYLMGIIGVILRHPAGLVRGSMAIFVMAFSPKAVTGGLLGQLTVSASVSMRKAIQFGVSRGVFSNEAGIGAAGITAASADTDEPVRQGYISMTGVFFDTLVICFFTGLAIASSGLLGSLNGKGELLNGTELVVAVFQITYGVWGGAFVCVSIGLFAFATIAAWAYQGEKAFEYLVGCAKYDIGYRFVYALAVFVGAVCSLEFVWTFSDICNGLMAVPNLLGVLVLGLGRNGMCEEICRFR